MYKENHVCLYIVFLVIHLLIPYTFLISDDDSSLQTITTREVETTTITTTEDVSQLGSTPGTYNIFYSLTLYLRRLLAAVTLLKYWRYV